MRRARSSGTRRKISVERRRLEALEKPDEVGDADAVASAAAWINVGVNVQVGSRVGWRGGILQVLMFVSVLTTGETLYAVLLMVPMAEGEQHEPSFL